MPDFLSISQRRRLMRRVRTVNTVPEQYVRDVLCSLGCSISKKSISLPGSPDLLLDELKIAIFVDGSFWHGQHFDQWKDKLSPYWKEKIAANIKRDRRHRRVLRRMGWSVVRVWEKDLKKRPDQFLKRITRMLKNMGFAPKEVRVVNKLSYQRPRMRL